MPAVLASMLFRCIHISPLGELLGILELQNENLEDHIWMYVDTGICDWVCHLRLEMPWSVETSS